MPAPALSTQPLDIEQHDQLLRYLRETHRIDPDTPVELRTLTGGVSNRAVLLTFPDGAGWVLKQPLARLRTAVEWFSDPARIEREAAGIAALSRLAPPGSITPLIFFDPAHRVLAMAAVPQPHDNLKSLLLQGDLRDSHIAQLADLLSTIHVRSGRRRPEFAARFHDRSFFESLRLEPYYHYTADHVGAAAAFLHCLIRTTRRRRLTLVHGDFSPKNILVHRHRLILLDHEVIHFGDPAFDLGFLLTHLLSKAHHLPHHRPAFAFAARSFWRRYHDAVLAEPFAFDLERHAAAHTLGCMLARVVGRSKLEYLSDAERDHQRRVIIELMRRPPTTIDEFIDRFLDRLDAAPPRPSPRHSPREPRP